MRLSKTALNRISAFLIPLLIIAFIAVGYCLIKDEKADMNPMFSQALRHNRFLTAALPTHYL